jgi:hypothetical protein
MHEGMLFEIENREAVTPNWKGAGNTGTTDQSGAATPGTMTDLTALGQGKKQMLGVNLDRMADSVSGQTTVDPTGYLTSLNSKTVRSLHVFEVVKSENTF